MDQLVVVVIWLSAIGILVDLLFGRSIQTWLIAQLGESSTQFRPFMMGEWTRNPVLNFSRYVN
jgi:hypothetical protein